MLHRFPQKIRWLYALELALIVLLALFASRQYANFDPEWRLAGQETEYLTSSAEWVSDVFQKWHYIPQWQPYLQSGQPAVDEAYAFIVNPFNGAPILLFGGANGLKVSIILHFIIAGLGGWFLGWMLGWRSPARLLMGCLLILKGNMQSVIGLGFYQLGVTQAYFPWVLAGALAIVFVPSKRWPPVLLALALALLFFGGNLYNLLPTLIVVGLVVMAFCFRLHLHRPFVQVNTPRLLRFVLAGGLAAALVAVTALTIVLNYGLVRGHPDQTIQQVADPIRALAQFVLPEAQQRGLFIENLYSYSAPFWFVALLFILLPPIAVLHRPASRQQGLRLWIVGLVGLILFFTWAVGINPVINWMYDNLPLIAQWRFPERMMTMAAFLFIFLLALRFDGLDRAIVQLLERRRRQVRGIVRRLVIGVVFVVGGLAVVQVYATRYPYDYLWKRDTLLNSCINWLVAHNPDEFISVRRRDYNITTPMIRAGVRMQHIGAAYDLGGLDSQVYPFDLKEAWPEFYMPAWDDDPGYLQYLGYQSIPDSPPIAPDLPRSCLWRKADALSYAFSIPVDSLLSAPFPLPTPMTTPVTYLGRTPEYIALRATGSSVERTVVVAQDVDYPGWTVRVDGQASDVLSVGQMLGVVLPPGETAASHLIEFIYNPLTLKLGGLITILAAIGSALYLLRPPTTKPEAERALLAPVAELIPAPTPVLVIDDTPRVPEANPPIRILATSPVVHITVPPSDLPSRIEVTYPQRWRDYAGVASLVGVALIAVYLLVSGRRPRR